MLIHRTYDVPKPLLDQSTGDVVWCIPCLVDEGELINHLFETEEHAWQFFNEVNYQFQPMKVDDAGGQDEDDTEVPTTQT